MQATNNVVRKRRHRARLRHGNNSGGGVEPIFWLPLTTSLVPARNAGSGTPTFSRASTAYVQDHEGILRQAPANAARFWGARYVRNLFTATTTLGTQGVTVGVWRVTVSFTGTGTITFTGAFAGSLVGTGAADRVQTTFTTTAGTLTCTVTGSVTFAQCENVTGQSIETASEYVSVGVLSSPFHGANVDGLQYFSTDKNGAPIPSGTLKRFFREPAAAQLLSTAATCRNWSIAPWTVVNMTRAFTSTGVDGVSNSATRLTASAALATILQPVAGVASNRTFSCYMRRITGVGQVRLFQGATFSAALTLTSAWQRVFLYASVDVSVLGVGVQIDVSGDAVDVDFANFEATTANTTIGTSFIEANAGASRSADSLTYPAAGNILNNNGTAYCEATSPLGVMSNIQNALHSTNNEVIAVNSFGGQTLMRDATPSTVISSGGTSQAQGVTRRFASKWLAGGTKAVMSTGSTFASNACAAGGQGVGASLNVGAGGAGSLQFAGCVGDIRIYAQPMSDARFTAMVA